MHTSTLKIKVYTLLILALLASNLNKRSFVFATDNPIGVKIKSQNDVLSIIYETAEIVEIEEEKEPLHLPHPVTGTVTDVWDVYEEYKEKNSDTVGYIYLPDSRVNYPIYYSNKIVDNEDYYLRYNSDGDKSAKGEIYLFRESNGLFGGNSKSHVTLLHGHSMRDKTMFGELLNYIKQDYADSHNVLNILDGKSKELKKYSLRSVVNVSYADNHPIPLEFTSEEAKRAYYDSEHSLSAVNAPRFENLDDILILNTCSYQTNDSRVLVYFERVE